MMASLIFSLKSLLGGINKMNLKHILPTDSLLHEHEACTQMYIMQYQVCRDIDFFGERNNYFLLVTPEKMSWRRQRLS